MAALEFLTDPREFLAAAGGFLAAAPVVSTIVSTNAERAAIMVAAGLAQDPRDWYVVARGEDGTVTGAAMRTAPFEPRPLFVLPMPEDAAVALAVAMHERGEAPGGANGALPAARIVAEETARLAGATVSVSQRLRLFELGELAWPRPVPGALRRARLDEVELCLEWFARFADDADEQAGRSCGSHHSVSEGGDSMARRIESDGIWLWEVQGRVVNLTGCSPPAFGVVRVAPVFTPPAERGHGFASAAVAQLSARITAHGHRACLFTDLANPTSNAIYQRLGYRPVVDMANHAVT